MSKKSLLFAAVFVAGLSTAGAASAQETVFDGFYVGGQVGYSSIDAEVSTSAGSAEDDIDGFGGGGFVGFGFTNGGFYGGVEAGIGYDGAEWSETGGGITVDIETQLTYDVGVRLGGVVSENVLVYGRIGWVRTNTEFTVTGLGSDDEDFDGFRFGGGLEALIADNISVRGEYTFTSYETLSTCRA